MCAREDVKSDITALKDVTRSLEEKIDLLLSKFNK